MPRWSIAERWHGMYAKHCGGPIVRAELLPEVHVRTGTGGAGMTLSLGLAEADSLVRVTGKRSENVDNSTWKQSSIMKTPSRMGALLLDWAGTTIDYGSRAPTSVFLEIFRQSGIEITAAEARGPMGMAKREHIATLLRLPRIAQAWTERLGQRAEDTDIEQLYQQFLPLQKATLADHCDLIPGVLDLVDACRRDGIRIGSTTGYTRQLMDLVEPLAAAKGYAPDVLVCSQEVTAGRPAPWSNFQAAERLGVYPISEILVVDDTIAGIQAGRKGGMWTVAVTQTGNALGLSQAEVSALPAAELTQRLAEAESQFFAAGAHYCLPSVDELPRLLASFGG